jgi:hypothetical protein
LSDRQTSFASLGRFGECLPRASRYCDTFYLLVSDVPRCGTDGFEYRSHDMFLMKSEQILFNPLNSRLEYILYHSLGNLIQTDWLCKMCALYLAC